MERTFVMLKPDTLQRGIVGEVISRLEKKGLKLIAMKMIKLNDDILKEHYKHHLDKPFFPNLLNFMKSGPVIATVWEGKDAVTVVRKVVGKTNGREAEPGSIRGDYSMSVSKNIIHASDSVETAEIEIKRFFNDNELIEWERIMDKFVYSEDEL